MPPTDTITVFAPTADQLAVRAEFEAAVNMTVAEMEAHFATPESDLVSVSPKLAERRGTMSGRTAGKKALTLKRKSDAGTDWEESDYAAAAGCVRDLKRFVSLSKTRVLADEAGTPTRFTLALMSRGHDPRKAQGNGNVVEAVSMWQFEAKIRDGFERWFAAYAGVDSWDDLEWPRPWVGGDRIFPAEQRFVFEWAGDYFELHYRLGAGGAVEVYGEGRQVTQEWIPVTVADTADITGPAGVAESAAIVSLEEAEGEDGPKWTGYMIRAGAAKNRAANGKPRVYTEEALKAAVEEGLFDDVPGFQVDDVQHGDQAAVPATAGTWGKAAWDPIAKGVKNVFTWVKGKYPALLHARIKTALAENNAADIPVGFSITGTADVDSTQPNIIRKILTIRSCDPISFPSAGGTLLAVTESDTPQHKDSTMKTTATKALAAKGLTVPARVAKVYDGIEVAEGAAAEFMVAQLKAKRPKMFERDAQLETKLGKDEPMLVNLFSEFLEAEGVEPTKPEDPPADPPAADPAPMNEATLRMVNNVALSGMLAESGLDDVQKASVRKRFVDRTTFDPAAVQTAITEAKEMQDAYKSAAAKNGGVRVTESSEERLRTAVNDFFFQDIRDAATRASIAESVGISRNVHGSIYSIRELVRMLLPGIDPMRAFSAQVDVAEAMDTALATKLLTNGINARIVHDYGLASPYDDFRAFVSFVAQSDYQTKSAMAFGGFAGFADVSKANDYPEITDSGLTSESYAVVKKGGIINIAEEDIRNDNVGYVASLPSRLAKLARRKMSAFAWNLITSNPTLASDSTALFAAGHNNLLADVLASTSLRTAIGMLQSQTHPESTDKLMTRPAFLGIGSDPILGESAHKLVTPAADQQNAVASFTQKFGMRILVNPHTTDVDDWYLIGDPSETPVIEIGLLDNREIPEVTTAQAEGVGTWFSKDVAQWRVKQVYNGTVISYRGLVGSIV